MFTGVDNVTPSPSDTDKSGGQPSTGGQPGTGGQPDFGGHPLETGMIKEFYHNLNKVHLTSAFLSEIKTKRLYFYSKIKANILL